MGSDSKSPDDDQLDLSPDSYLEELTDEHRTWLSNFDLGYANNFEKLLTDQYECAMVEASIRRILENYGATVEPSEDLTGSKKSPDFLCRLNTNRPFYVEATSISIRKSRKKTGLPHPIKQGPQYYSNLNRDIWQAVNKKASQCSDLDFPALVAVGTLHSEASRVCITKTEAESLLLGKKSLAWSVDANDGSVPEETWESTAFDESAFLKLEKGHGLAFARSSISGLLLCGLGMTPPNVIGVLHPNPVRPFRHHDLPEIPSFTAAIAPDKQSIRTSWVGKQST